MFVWGYFKAYDSELESKKHLLLSSVQDTQRGLLTTPDQRSSIEEALVNVEGRNMGHPINLAKLDGTWRLQYTSAPDVLILLQAAATLPFFQVHTNALSISPSQIYSLCFLYSTYLYTHHSVINARFRCTDESLTPCLPFCFFICFHVEIGWTDLSKI